MNKPLTYIVRPQDERPARPDGTCFYCQVPIGELHKKDCVCRSKTCVVDFNIRMVVSVPEFWDAEQIDFHYNESSWCADSLLNLIEDRRKRARMCLCNITSAEFIREATEEDEEEFGYDPSREE